MKRYLRFTNGVMFGLSIAIGLLFYRIRPIYDQLLQKEFQFVLLIVLFFILYLFIEIGALRRLDIKTRIRILGNPLVNLALFQFILIFAGGILIYVRSSIDELIDQVIFTIFVWMLVGAIFETYRLLRSED